MNLVGELVLARNQILQVGARVDEPGFLNAAQRINLVTTELQQQVMKTRMQPIGNVWSKLPRVVRDLAMVCGKQVRVEMNGKDTELDRTILEAIKDPLTHIVRNAIDHGIEEPGARAGKGKPKTGTLSLRAYHEGGQVNIEVSDDGAGLNFDAIRTKAVERQLISAERASRLSDYELAQLVFLPGFSTAAKVTNVSGRGVGMDVVKTNIEKIGGVVDLLANPGSGTTVKIRIPLTLAIVPAIIVSSAHQRFAIPQTNLLEMLRFDEEEVKTAVEIIDGAAVYRLRGRLLPIVNLGHALGLGEQSFKNGALNLIVLQAGDDQFGLVVDEVGDTEEIVVKPLGKELKGITSFAGATIMGDGRVALILDVVGLAEQAKVSQRGAEHTTRTSERNDTVTERKDQRSLVIFGLEDGGSMAVPLSEVARLEEFPRQRVEQVGDSFVVQYRGEVLPLITLGSMPEDTGGLIRVIVYSFGDRSIGFVVSRIIDVIDEAVRVENCAVRDGVDGAAIVQGKVTEILDVEGVIRSRAPWFPNMRAA